MTNVKHVLLGSWSIKYSSIERLIAVVIDMQQEIKQIMTTVAYSADTAGECQLEAHMTNVKQSPHDGSDSKRCGHPMEAVDRDGLEKEFSTQGDRALGKPTRKPEHTAIMTEFGPYDVRFVYQSDQRLKDICV